MHSREALPLGPTLPLTGETGNSRELIFTVVRYFIGRTCNSPIAKTLRPLLTFRCHSIKVGTLVKLPFHGHVEIPLGCAEDKLSGGLTPTVGGGSCGSCCACVISSKRPIASLLWHLVSDCQQEFRIGIICNCHLSRWGTC